MTHALIFIAPLWEPYNMSRLLDPTLHLRSTRCLNSCTRLLPLSASCSQWFYLSLTFRADSSLTLHAYSDADWAECPDDRRSTSTSGFLSGAPHFQHLGAFSLSPFLLSGGYFASTYSMLFCFFFFLIISTQWLNTSRCLHLSPIEVLFKNLVRELV